MTEREHDKPWTHPSIQRLSDAELRTRLEDARQRAARDAAEFAHHPDRDTVAELLASYRHSIDNYERALAER